MRVIAVLLCLALQLAPAAVDEAAALSAARKFQQIAERSLPSGTTVEISEDELNAFLKIHGALALPDGVEHVEVSLRQGGAVLGARIDLEAAGKAIENLPVLMRLLLKGERSILVDGDLAIEEGRGALEIVSVQVEGVEIPESVMEWFIEAYAPPEFRPYLTGEEAEVRMGLSGLRLEPGRAVAIVE